MNNVTERMLFSPRFACLAKVENNDKRLSYFASASSFIGFLIFVTATFSSNIFNLLPDWFINASIILSIVLFLYLYVSTNYFSYYLSKDKIVKIVWKKNLSMKEVYILKSKNIVNLLRRHKVNIGELKWIGPFFLSFILTMLYISIESDWILSALLCVVSLVYIGDLYIQIIIGGMNGS